MLLGRKAQFPKKECMWENIFTWFAIVRRLFNIFDLQFCDDCWTSWFLFETMRRWYWVKKRSASKWTTRYPIKAIELTEKKNINAHKIRFSTHKELWKSSFIVISSIAPFRLINFMFQNCIVTDLAKTGTCLRLKLDLPFLMQFAICQKTLCDGVACLDALMRNAKNVMWWSCLPWCFDA